ncbi:MAG: cysteine desulfurase family protein [Bacillota bacterium]|jgi:cysteine desulfurase
MQRVYIDNAATTPVYQQVAELMKDYMINCSGNPSSLHEFGREAKTYLEKARRQVAHTFDADAEEVFFTSGGTEANNMAIIGAAMARGKGSHIITSQVEHPSVLSVCKFLAQNGFDVTFLPVDGYAMVDPDDLKKALRPDTVLVSIMHANNEVGTINPIGELGAICREAGVLFHVDAVQSWCKVPFTVQSLNADLISLSAHKINGPKGVGALYKRKTACLARFIHGGGQEKKVRSGTENMPGIVGMGLAAEMNFIGLEQNVDRWKKLRDSLVGQVLDTIEYSQLNGHPVQRLPHNANLSFDYIEGEALLLHLDINGIACSTGSACASNSDGASHVLQAMKVAEGMLNSALRLTIGYGNTQQDIDYTAKILREKVDHLRSFSPHFHGK